MPVMTTQEYAEHLKARAIEDTLCAGRGDYTKWDTRLASQKAKDRKLSRTIAHCPSEQVSLMPEVEHPEIDYGCPEEIADELAKRDMRPNRT